VSVWIAASAFVLSLLTSVVAVTVVIVQMRARVAMLAEQDTRREEREDAAAKEVTDLLLTLRTFIAAQTEINKGVGVGLAAVVEKLGELEKQIVETATVTTLLSEVLKRIHAGVSIEP
jgi:hypothetical protein